MPLSPEYKAYLQSSHWINVVRPSVLLHYGNRCAVCNLDYKKRHDHLEIHHYHYWWKGESIIGKEVISRDLCPLCGKHHVKGAMSKAAIRQWRNSYLFCKLLVWLFRLVWDPIWWFLKSILAWAWQKVVRSKPQ